VAAAAVAERFVAARLAAQALSGFPGVIPADLAAAYACQEAAIAAWPDTIAGWKIGRIMPDLASHLGAERLAGPVFGKAVWPAAPGHEVIFPVFEGGFAAIEAEFVIELGRDVPPEDRAWTREELLGLVRELRAGVETAGSPLATINELGPTVVVSDFGNNAGLILGPPIRDWRNRDFEDMTCETFIDTERVGRGGAGALPGGPIGALGFLLGLLGRRGRTLAEGSLISTGATTGIHSIRTGQRGRVVFDGQIDIACRGVPATPHR
jgi:2-keto-4-pentenoate hydratase